MHVEPSSPEPNVENIQGVGLAGFRKDHQELIFVEFGDAKSARKLLGHLQPEVANHKDVADFNALFSEIRRRTGEDPDPDEVEATWTAVLLSARGLEVLKADLTELAEGEGKTAFTEGMAGRSAQIGDTRPGDLPGEWEKAFRPGADRVHALIIIAADRADDLARHIEEVRERIASTGCKVAYSERGHTLEGKLRGHEHFGFKDGVSQPSVIGIDPEPAAGEPPAVALGEFVLGYPDHNGETAAVGDLFTDGSFVVFRRLRQHVFAFRQQTQTTIPGAEPVPSPDQLAAKMVGRWPSGTPTETSPDEDPGEAGVTNAFAYAAEDDQGLRTPRFAHVRKVNPRDETRPPEEIEPVERRRMIRRGTPFGEPLPAGATEEDRKERGLHFISVVSDVARQFEFVQSRWMNDPNFPSGGRPEVPGGEYTQPVSGEPSDGPDPIVGEHDPGVEDALHQPGGVHTFALGPQVVNVTAGEYFFAPSISALAELATKDK
jgi:Dyp-type peroxidase family